MSEHQERVEAGAIAFAMHYRDDIAGDEGLCIEVRAEVEGEDTELLRFDCFRVAPHYHYGPQADDERLMLDLTAAGNALDWTLDCFQRGRLGPMIERAGYPGVAESLDAGALGAAMPNVVSAAREIAASRQS
ncbi:MAG: hypothetical protein OXH13_08620 [Chloroflexi bacterium]|nr:hypothetical protein [Chloroflexota bacterium]MCY3697533.1 hypothetical protein [Chloroflexota bacterium]MXX79787.1 hypothetical protein [Chloroflexota bacterium]MYB21724.1 hypothetical protein [Chloroflexota bacterium]MYF23376.1 hypothetical protein [Chloroflexota bacterium]